MMYLHQQWTQQQQHAQAQAMWQQQAMWQAQAAMSRGSGGFFMPGGPPHSAQQAAQMMLLQQAQGPFMHSQQMAQQQLQAVGSGMGQAGQAKKPSKLFLSDC